MMADGGLVDGSWELTITVTDLQVERTLRVKGDIHIGGVMLRLVEALDIALDWSDHALWWPEKNMWLKRTKSTLDQYGVQADARLQFTPMHKMLNLHLPDLQIMDMRVDFSVNVFAAVVHMCRQLGIRHPEELSIMRKLDKEDIKRGVRKKYSVDGGPSRPLSMNASMNGTPHFNTSSHSPDNTLNTSFNRMSSSPHGTLLRSPHTPSSPYNVGVSSSPYINTFNGTFSPGSMNSLSFEGLEATLINTPHIPAKEAFTKIHRPKNFTEKSNLNAVWLDSSRSLMEQGLRENESALLRFKFFIFYDLNPKYDAIRVNQVYGQARWSLIAEQVDCTEEEMIMFAALQLQVEQQVNVPQPDPDVSMVDGNEDEVDAALKDLQESLEGNSISTSGDITHIPELADYLRFFKPKKFTLKSFKRFWCTLKDTQMSFYRSRDEANGPPITKVNILGCEAHPDVNLSTCKYGIKLFVPGLDGMSDMWLRFDSENQYVRWMAACRLAAKGRTMADSSYESEVQAISKFLSMQHTNPTPVISSYQADNLQIEDYMSSRFAKKLKSKQLGQRIVEAHGNVKDMNLIQAKLAYIKAWQALPEYGVSYFIIKMKGTKKEELMGIASNRVIRMDLHSGDSLKTWRYNTMKSWDVNWETKNVILDFGEENKVTFSSVGADCKVIHEYIGGYIFLSMRSQEKNQSLNEELFHKLTGGWH